MSVTVPFSAPQGTNTTVTCALLRPGGQAGPAAVTFTEAGTGVTQGATSITVTDVTTTLAAGQWLIFVDGSDNHFFPVKVTADYDSGTTLAIAAAAEAIPAGATAAFPPKLFLRTSADISSSTSTNSVNTYDHGSNSSVSIGETTNSFTSAGLYSDFDPSVRTIKEARDLKQLVWISRQLEAPTGFTTGTIEAGAAIVSSFDSAAPNDGRVSADFTLEIDGAISETVPA